MSKEDGADRLAAGADGSTISGLMPVYGGVDPSHLREALESVQDQTRRPDELVIVEDGPLGDEHHRLIGRFASSGIPVVHVVLPVNSGAGVANGAGLARASSTWIAKMDADDINEPQRLDRQLSFVLEHRVDVASAPMLQFTGDRDQVSAVRGVPRTHDEIAARMRINNPLNHPASFYRRSVAVAAGGYPDMRYMQDYDLFARMLVGGARFENMTEPLVRFRADDRMYRRRSSRAMDESERTLQRNLHAYGVVGRGRARANLVLRTGFRRLPAPMLQRVYGLLFLDRSSRDRVSRSTP